MEAGEYSRAPAVEQAMDGAAGTWLVTVVAVVEVGSMGSNLGPVSSCITTLPLTSSLPR